jgi:hypothetical protein
MTAIKATYSSSAKRGFEMPWKPSDATGKTKKAKSVKAKKQWSTIANSVLSKTGNEKRAIMEASGVVAKRKTGHKTIMHG